MSRLHQSLSSNLDGIETRIAAACVRAGRARADVQLVAVTKYAPWPVVRAAVELGLTDLGENRPQQLAARADQLAEEMPSRAVQWHLIGQLQRNKVRPMLQVAHLIHSVDSSKLCDRISRLAGELGRRARILLEVNVSGEGAKSGFVPDTLRDEWPTLVRLPHVEYAGLMTMAPAHDDPSAARPVFQALRHLRDELSSHAAGGSLHELSMGMSGDFEVAIEEGATLVRIGSSLFAGCEYDEAGDGPP
ncbi:MAG: YggS family pyridoxal phosphate-dependent enzyme [Planctomycetaceae bacterium]